MPCYATDDMTSHETSRALCYITSCQVTVRSALTVLQLTLHKYTAVYCKPLQLLCRGLQYYVYTTPVLMTWTRTEARSALREMSDCQLSLQATHSFIFAWRGNSITSIGIWCFRRSCSGPILLLLNNAFLIRCFFRHVGIFTLLADGNADNELVPALIAHLD